MFHLRSEANPRPDPAQLEEGRKGVQESGILRLCRGCFVRRPHILAVTAVVIVGPWAVEFFTAITVPLFFYYAPGVLGCDTPVEPVHW